MVDQMLFQHMTNVREVDTGRSKHRGKFKGTIETEVVAPHPWGIGAINNHCLGLGALQCVKTVGTDTITVS